MSQSIEQESLFTGYTGHLFLTFSLGWLLIQVGMQLLPPLLPQIIADLSITPAEAGIALTLQWLAYALLQFPGGRLSDQLSRKTLLVGGSVLIVAGLLVLTRAVAYSVFLVGVTVVGLGAGLFTTPARALVSDLFVERRGQAVGLHVAAGDIGTVLAAGVAVVALAVAPWQWSFLPVALALALVTVVVHILSRESYVIDGVAFDVRGAGRRLYADSYLMQILVAYALFTFVWQSVAGFLPTYLTAEKGMSLGLASAAFAVYFGVGILAKPLAGLLADRIDRATVATGGLGLASGGLGVMLFAGRTAVIFVGVSIFAIGFSMFSPVIQAYLMDLIADGTMGSDLGAARSFAIGLGAVGPTYVGIVASFSDYSWAFGGLFVCLLASVALLHYSPATAE
ncbi:MULTISPECIES: MFS transporter [Salinibaculum]|uniref:MFS transporter n=1 Tax=Salinibaculum TaxID=2732368 RepID=UPI0030D4AF00